MVIFENYCMIIVWYLTYTKKPQSFPAFASLSFWMLQVIRVCCVFPLNARFIRLNGGPVLNGCNMNRCYITRFGCQWLVPPAQSTCEAWATPCWPENRAEPLQGSSFLERIWKVIIFALMLRFQQPWCCTWRGRSLLVWCFPITFPRALGEDSMTSNFLLFRGE